MGNTLIKPEGFPKWVLNVILIYTLAKEKTDRTKLYVNSYRCGWPWRKGTDDGLWSLYGPTKDTGYIELVMKQEHRHSRMCSLSWY